MCFFSSLHPSIPIVFPNDEGRELGQSIRNLFAMTLYAELQQAEMPKEAKRMTEELSWRGASSLRVEGWVENTPEKGGKKMGGIFCCWVDFVFVLLFFVFSGGMLVI